MAGPLIPKQYFDGVAADKRLKFDPSVVTLPTLTVGLVYALDSSGDVVLATPTSVLVLGVYVGDNNDGYPIFEQLYYTSVGAFTARGTRWYLGGAGTLTSVMNDALFGVAIDADTLLITWAGPDTGGAAPSTSVDVEENSVNQAAGIDTLDFLSDEVAGIAFVNITGGAKATLSVDKQINYNGLAGSVSGQFTGFSFDRTVYRACELIYTIEKDSVGSELETGHIMMMHDGTNAGLVVTHRGTELAPFTQGDPGVEFSAAISGANCVLNYTETNGDAFNLQIKARPIRVNAP